MFTVIGKERRNGVYEGKVYDNTYLHCSYDKKTCEGVAVTTIKGKTAELGDVEIGQVCDFYYDRYGNCIGVK